MNESICWRAHWKITKYKSGDVQPYATEEFSENLGLNVGLAYLIDSFIVGDAFTAFSNTDARLGVGNDSTAASASQTDLQYASAVWKAMDAGYPARTNQSVEFRATFTSAEANFNWQEYAVDNGATDHIVLNRKVSDKGTKASGETWTLSLTLTFS